MSQLLDFYHLYIYISIKINQYFVDLSSDIPEPQNTCSSYAADILYHERRGNMEIWDFVLLNHVVPYGCYLSVYFNNVALL